MYNKYSNSCLNQQSSTKIRKVGLVMKNNTATKQKKLAAKLTIRIIVGLLFIFIALIFAISKSTETDLAKRESEKLVLLANENATIAKEFMETMINKQEVVIGAIQNLKPVDDENKVRYLTNLLTSVKKGQSDILSVFFVAQPNTFIQNSPNGFSIFATDKGTHSQKNQFTYVDENLYNKAKEVKNLTIVDPFEKTIDGTTYNVITVFQPVFDSQNNLIGLIGSNIDTAMLNGAKYNNGGFESFSNQIICGHQTVIIHSTNSSAIGKKFADITTSMNPQIILDSANNPSPFTFLDTSKNGEKEYRAFTPFYIGTSNVVWLSGTSISESEFNSQIINQVIEMALYSLICLVFLAIFVYILINQALKPIHMLDTAAKQMAIGNLNINITHHSDDELGSLANSLNNSAETLSFYINDIDRAMGEMSAGNFNVEPSRPFIGDFAHIEVSIKKFITTMSTTIYKINQAAEQVAGGSRQISDSAQEMSNGAEQQTYAVEKLSLTISDISNQIEKNAVNAHDASKRAFEVGNEVIYGNEQMQKMTGAMNDIITSSSEIGKIIKTINDIAFQTNILALNAAVEAARAGSAGKGFAVVADEVRNLAGKSAEAAKNTTSMIQTSINAVQVGSTIADATANSLMNIVSGAKEMTDVIDKIAKASKEQASSVSQVTNTVIDISGVIKNNSAISEESAAASEELYSQAQMLKNLVDQFEIKKDETKI